MNHPTDLQALARRAGTGDSGALRKLRQELHHCLGPIVRRALRKQEDTLGLCQRLRATAEELLALDELALGDAERVVVQLTWSICEECVAQAYRPPGRHLALETVRNW
jgi:hypothetical protein